MPVFEARKLVERSRNYHKLSKQKRKGYFPKGLYFRLLQKNQKGNWMIFSKKITKRKFDDDIYCKIKSKMRRMGLEYLSTLTFTIHLWLNVGKYSIHSSHFERTALNKEVLGRLGGLAALDIVLIFPGIRKQFHEVSK